MFASMMKVVWDASEYMQMYVNMSTFLDKIRAKAKTKYFYAVPIILPTLNFFIPCPRIFLPFQ